MELDAYFEPAGLKKSAFPDKEMLYHHVSHYAGDKHLLREMLSSCRSFIIGAPQDSHSPGQSSKEAPAAIRAQLYALYPPQKQPKLCDLGNLRLPEQASQANTALRDVCHYLLKQNKNIILIGGGQYLTYGPFQAYGQLGRGCHILSLNARAGLSAEGTGPDPSSYLDQVIFQKDKHLASHTTLGIQQYYTSKGQRGMMDKQSWEYYRLGRFRDRIEESEPLLREKDIVTVNMNCVRQADAPGHHQPSTTGLSAEALCQISRYAGSGTTCGLFGLFGLSPGHDQGQQSASLAGLAIWHYIDGLGIRRDEHPAKDPGAFKQYHIHTENPGHELRFHQSRATRRWWAEEKAAGQKESHYKPVDENAYQNACKGGSSDPGA